MAKTPNLGLEITTESSTLFEDWRKAINGEGEGPTRSNAQIIDDFVQTIYGVSGQVVLDAAFWSQGVYPVTVDALGINDAIFFTPLARADKEALEEADIIISVNEALVSFTAQVTPVITITLEYFVSRGRANE